MNLHEYQAKQLLTKYGINIPRGEVTDNPSRAAEIFKNLNISRGAVKAQIHAGGRGKAGGIKIVSLPAEAEKAAAELLGQTLITHQTGPKGKPVNKILVEELFPAEAGRELYLGIAIDRQKACPVMMFSTEGGMEIEELARRAPEKIVKVLIDSPPELPLDRINELLQKENLKPFAFHLKPILTSLARLFLENDCSLAEINPLVITKDGKLVALDAKINLDDRALFRHKDLVGWRDLTQEDPLEAEASKFGLSYVGLDGNIGCLVNGAGLAMSTMDLIKLHGGEPANFLDVGGGASVEQVTEAFKLLLANKNVKAILVNIFGGIMKCDVIAEGITTAVKQVGLRLPLVVRLEGTNVELGKNIIKKSGLNIVSVDTMNEAAKKVVGFIK
ncbi:MAG: ADP-forming succinate--CoA ligase subunit beta [Planctomycetota bacterium]